MKKLGKFWYIYHLWTIDEFHVIYIFRPFFNQMTVVLTRARVRTLKRCKSHEEKENQRKNAKNPPFAIIML